MSDSVTMISYLGYRNNNTFAVIESINSMFNGFEIRSQVRNTLILTIAIFTFLFGALSSKQ